MYYDFTGLPVIIENTQLCAIILLRSLGIQYDNIPRPGHHIWDICVIVTSVTTSAARIYCE